MRSFGIYDQRTISGLLIIACFTACFIFMVTVFYTSAGDEQIVIDQMYKEILQEKELGRGKYIPRVSKWDFTIRLPVEGSAGTFHWMVKGAYATNYMDRGQLIYGFVGETMDKKNPVRLVSSEMVFDDMQKELYTNKPVYAELGWGSISGNGLRLKWKHDIIEIKSNVEVALEPGNLPEEARIVDIEDNKTKTESTNKAETNKDKKQDENSGQLIITSDKLKIFGKEDKAIFTGKVIARDNQGTISANVMEVQNYTKEERKADPTRTGIKTVVCKGSVKIDLTDQAAKCQHAIFDAATNIITLLGEKVDGKYIQVEYWKKAEKEGEMGQQILCDKMIINRETKEVEFLGNQKSTDFNPSKSSFLDFGLADEKEEKDSTDSTNGNRDR